MGNRVPKASEAGRSPHFSCSCLPPLLAQVPAVSSRVAVPFPRDGGSSAWLAARVPVWAQWGRRPSRGYEGRRPRGLFLHHVLNDPQTNVWIQAGLPGKLGSCMLFALGSVGKRRNRTVVCRGSLPFGLCINCYEPGRIPGSHSTCCEVSTFLQGGTGI